MDRPNVVMIVADTFRRDHLGAYGNPYISTPHIDEFARSSVVFDQHVISSFPTMPARADMLTGTFSYTHMGWEPLPRHLTTLPDVLSKAGYHTMGVVDTPFFIRNGFGYDRGFDDFIWVRGQGDDTRPHERADARSTWRSEEDRMVARTVTQAERWLERHHDEQFFLYVDTWDPHEPWDAPEYYTRKYREGYDGEQIYPAYGNWKKAGLQKDDVDLGHATYCGEVTMVDFWIGRLLAKLDALGLRENTIVLFTSDHGFYFGEHDYFGKAEWVHDPEAEVSGRLFAPRVAAGVLAAHGRAVAALQGAHQHSPDGARAWPRAGAHAGHDDGPRPGADDHGPRRPRRRADDHDRRLLRRRPRRDAGRSTGRSWSVPGRCIWRRVRSSRPSTPRRAGSTTTCRSP